MTKLKEIAEHYGIGSAHTGTVDKYVIEAMRKYAEFCCEEQKKLCADKTNHVDSFFEDNTYWHTTEDILNSPTYKEDEK